MDNTFKTRNNILFNAAKKVEIPVTSDEIHLVEAVTANQEFSRYGFTLDVAGIMELAHNTPDVIADIKDEICDILDNAIGLTDFSMSEPFYPNFPEEVMEKSTFELAVNAMLYYTFSQTDDPEMTRIAHEIRALVTPGPEDKIVREPNDVPDRKDLKILTLAKPHDLEELLYNRTQALSMSKEQLNDIRKYSELYPETWADNIFLCAGEGTLDTPSHETRANIALIAFHHGDVEMAGKMLPNAEDVLRFAAALSAEKQKRTAIFAMDANLSLEPKYAAFKFTRPEKTAIKRFLEHTPDLFTSMWHREVMWKKLMNRLDTKDSRFPRTERAFDNLRNGNMEDEYGNAIKLSAGQALERLMDAIAADKAAAEPGRAGVYIMEYAKQYPKVFFRNIERIARAVDADSPACNGLCEAVRVTAQKIPAVQILKLKHHMERYEEWALRIFTNQKGGIHAEENHAPGISVRVKSRIAAILDNAVNASLKKEPAGKVYIAPELYGIKAPLRNIRNASDGATLTKYSVVDGNPENNIAAFGIFWKNAGNERADIDLAVVGYNEDFQDRQLLSYFSLKKPWGVHSGDYTSGMIAPEINGAVEYIFADKALCKRCGIRYLIAQINGFNVPFSKAESLRFCFFEKQGSLDDVESMKEKHAPMFKGEIINPVEMNTSYRLTQNTTSTVPLLYDVEEEKFIWIDMDIGCSWILYTNSLDKQVRSRTGLVLYEAQHNDYPAMGELFERYAKANGGEITNDIKEADKVFSFGNIDREEFGLKETAEIITSLELDRISSEFCSATRENIG